MANEKQQSRGTEEHRPAVAGVQEDWMQDMEPARPNVPEGLAGMHKVTHGTLFFSPTKQIKAGRHVKLTAEEAFHLGGHGLPAPDPEDPRPPFQPVVHRVG